MQSGREREKKWITVDPSGYFSYVSFARAASRLRCAMLATIVVVASAWLAPPGAAAEGTAPVLPQVPALPDAAAVPADAAAITAAAVELAESVLPAVAQAPAALPAVTSSAPAPAVAPVSAAQTTDITPETPDTAANGSAATKPVAPDKPPAAGATAGQAQPVNVNVSVRIGSAGNDGAVTQLNASAAVAAAAPSAPALPTADAVPTADAEAPAERPAAQAQASGVVGSSVAPGEQTLQVSPDTWIWNWNCRDSPIGIPQLAGSLPANWNWNWDCGSENTDAANTGTQLPSQYQATASQYQPVNINVSVRIASPGDNGPVVQTNLAVAVATAVVAPVAPAKGSGTPASDSVPAGLPPPLASVSVAVAGVAPALEALSEVATIALTLVRNDELALSEADEILRGASILVEPRGQRLRHGLLGARRIPDRQATPSALRLAVTLPAPLTGVATDRRAQESAPARTVAEQKQPPRATSNPPAPLPSPPTETPLATLNLGGAAPGGGGDTGSLFLLLIPFAFAFAEAARCVARDRPALLAQVESSRRERPG